MRSTWKRILAFSLLGSCAFVAIGCNNTPNAPGTDETPPTAEVTPAPTQPPADITEETDYVTEQWIAVEIPFEATERITKIEQAEVDVTFTNRTTSTTLKMPAFWNGGEEWKVRFAPTECGIWDYTVSTKGTDLGLAGKTGTLACNSYKGDLEIYKRGFLKTEKDTRYFLYNDGTPFFYLGDTHWTMLTEEFDSAGPNADGIDTDSHFKYIVDKRVEQKFTVYQSEPIGAGFDATNGITRADIKGFERCDEYFQYIADKGLVHANAQLIFPGSITQNFFDDDYLYHATRYWVARYAAYPVLWTLGQEVDDAPNFSTLGDIYPIYQKMCKIIYELDPYKHPITAHQMNAATIGAVGNTPVRGVDGGYGNYDPSKTQITGTTKRSVFFGMEEHTWWGAQWRPTVDQQYNFEIPKNYWDFGEGKVTINYESRYDHLYTKNFGARVSGWISYLSGMYGYGYGGADMWYYKTTYTMNEPAYDGIDNVTVEDKKTTWGQMMKMPIGDQMTYLRNFFTNLSWWKLIPEFDNNEYFIKSEAKSGYYAAAHDENNTYVVYLYNKTTDSAGLLGKMDTSATYTAKWFDPRTGEYTTISDKITAADDGTYDIPQKPVADDMDLLVTKN